MANAVRVGNEPYFKFGIEVPRNVNHALYLDRINGNSYWRDTILHELQQVADF